MVGGEDRDMVFVRTCSDREAGGRHGGRVEAGQNLTTDAGCDDDDEGGHHELG